MKNRIILILDSLYQHDDSEVLTADNIWLTLVLSDDFKVINRPALNTMELFTDIDSVEGVLRRVEALMSYQVEGLELNDPTIPLYSVMASFISRNADGSFIVSQEASLTVNAKAGSYEILEVPKKEVVSTTPRKNEIKLELNVRLAAFESFLDFDMREMHTVVVFAIYGSDAEIPPFPERGIDVYLTERNAINIGLDLGMALGTYFDDLTGRPGLTNFQDTIFVQYRITENGTPCCAGTVSINQSVQSDFADAPF